MRKLLGAILFLGAIEASAQSAVLSGGGTQEVNTIHHQFVIGDLAVDIVGDEGVVLGGLQEVILNNTGIQYPSTTTSVNIGPALTGIKVELYPNPAGNQVMIDQKEARPMTYQLSSRSGQLLQTGQINEANSALDLQGYPSGAYYLQLQSKQTQQSVTISIIKQ